MNHAFLELVVLSISVSGSAECAGCAYEATDDFTFFVKCFSFFFQSSGAAQAFTEIRCKTETEINLC